eukprot:1600658-Karenia_brevis.AAC.1
MKAALYGQIFMRASEVSAAAQLRSFQKLDLLAQLEKHASSIDQLFCTREPSSMYRHISKYLPRAPRSGAYIQDKDGTLANGVDGHKRNFRDYMQDVMFAQPSSFSAHIQKHRCTYANGVHNLSCVAAGADFTIDPDLFPSVSQLTCRLYHPVATKFVASACSPVQWAGGQLFELLKPGGSAL